MFFHISVAAELAVFALANTARTVSPSRDCQASAWPRDTRNVQAPLAKIVIRSKLRQIHLVK